MSSIQKVSHYMKRVIGVLFYGVPLLTLGPWIFMEVPLVKSLIQQGMLFQPVQTPQGVVNLGTLSWTFLGKSLGALGSSVSMSPVFLSLFYLKRLFKNYEKGDIFSPENAKIYQNLGILFFAEALLAQPLSELFMVLAVTFANEPGHRFISVSFGTPNMATLFCGMVVIVISWIMKEASQLAEDQRFTV